MSARWERQVLQWIVAEIDGEAVGGREIRLANLDPRIFDSKPESHDGPLAMICREAYSQLQMSAILDGRLERNSPLVKSWKLLGDIYSPKLRRFIEVDESQHFSKPRLARLAVTRSESWAGMYPDRFWEKEFPRLVLKPRRDLDPPHRDEARAYRDELRERLPIAYGLKRTIRLDEYSLAAAGLSGLESMLSGILDSEN